MIRKRRTCRPIRLTTAYISRIGLRVLQLESIPWHSANLRSSIKEKLPSLIVGCEQTRRYAASLKRYLADKSVISIDGMGSQSGITKRSFDTNWLKFKADLIGLDLAPP